MIVELPPLIENTWLKGEFLEQAIVWLRRSVTPDLNCFCKHLKASYYAARVKRAVQSKRMSAHCEQSSDRASDFPKTHLKIRHQISLYLMSSYQEEQSETQ